MKNSDTFRKLAEIRGCLSRLATHTARRRNEYDEDLLVEGVDPFLIDTELKIASSKAVRRMSDKTQVVTDPANQHVRRRITHCGEVAAVGCIISAVLGLNVELTRAIALGHDIGHPPFGHDGEDFLTKAAGRRFRHEIMSIVIAQHVERRGQGLNLTHEVLSGFVQHKIGRGSLEVFDDLSAEAEVDMYSDKFAYITGDYNDLARIGYGDLMPVELVDLMRSLGSFQRERVNKLVEALCLESAENGRISFSKSDVAKTFLRIKELMYTIYPIVNASNGVLVLERIFKFIQNTFKDVDPILAVALMTDQDALYLADQSVLDFSHFQQTTVAELIPFLRGRKIAWWDKDLDW